MLGVLPTGAGKTVVMADIFREFPGASCAIAHRQELVSQISMAMANVGVVHRIIAPKPIINHIIKQHVNKFDRSFYNSRSNHAVAGIDTLIRHESTLRDWARQVQLWEMDEAHHVQIANKWGRGVHLFPNALGIGWTATPRRADRKSLSRGQGGVFDQMVVGPSMRDLINQGHLTDFKIYGPPQSVDVSDIAIGASGELNHAQTVAKVRKSKIIGDIVTHYKTLTPGKLGITFVVDTDEADKTAREFTSQGIPAAVITAKTPIDERNRLIGKYKNREYLQLVNVDIFGEGFDLPAIEVVSMGRPTESFALFVQQFGRALRILPGKLFGILIDHVGNVARHGGAPDGEQTWTLDASPKRKKGEKSDGIKFCVECWQPYEPFRRICPHCGHCDMSTRQDKPEFVDGDLTEYSPELLAKMRGEAEKIMHALPDTVRDRDARSRVIYNQWYDRIHAQHDLRGAIAWWAGYHKNNLGLDDSMSYRIFWREFGIDVMGAQMLGAAAARDLARRITTHIETLRQGVERRSYG